MRENQQKLPSRLRYRELAKSDNPTIRAGRNAHQATKEPEVWDDIRGKLLSVPGVEDADVQVLFDPPWNMSMMSDAAKLQLGML